MCIIIYKPRGKNLKKEVYENCFGNNKDGAGFIIRQKTGELLLEKGFFTFQEFWEKFQPHQHKQAIVHFRIATHGEISIENCHPYWVAENKLAFAHNGVMNNVECKKDYSMSDTWHFNVNILQHLQEKLGDSFIDDPVIQELITQYISWSKLAFMREDGKVFLFNKSKGDIQDSVWYSNSSYKWFKSKYQKPQKAANDKLSSNVSPSLPKGSLVVPAIRKDPNGILRINDYIELIQPWKDLTGREIGLVMAFMEHGMIQAKVYDHSSPTGWKIRALPVGIFQKYSSNFSDNHNTYDSDGHLIERTIN